MKTELQDYTLWYDGVITVPLQELPSYILNGTPIEKLAVAEIDVELAHFNKMSTDKILIKETIDLPAKKLLIPESYEKLDINRYMEETVLPTIKHDNLYEERLKRFITEFDLFERNDMLYVLKVLIYVVDTFKQRGILWGVGRGSSCASYILYLIGLHSIDPVKYDIPINEFFKD